MKTRMLVLLVLLAGTSAFAKTRVSVGIQIGGGYPYGYYEPPPPPPVVLYTPPCPGPGYYWTPGSYYRVGPRYSWRVGYWSAPRYYGRGYREYGRGYRDRDDYRGRYERGGRHDRRDRHDRDDRYRGGYRGR
ncbi:MAG TPA: hypothetical protein VN428_17305 [Bryobacteraceae bacterium]|nr:hypothetical protein [Bryobacteraceae bacterium]